MKNVIVFASTLSFAIALTPACGTSSSSRSKALASTSFAITGVDFTGDSVRICGSRRPPADSRYFCNSTLSSPDDAGDAGCPCFNFGTDGTLVDMADGGPGIFTDLCASNDLAADAGAAAGPVDWTFDYSLFNGADCRGAQLNDGTDNLTCFDSRDLVAQTNPNASLEVLSPGLNPNHVVCGTGAMLVAASDAQASTAVSDPRVSTLYPACEEPTNNGAQCSMSDNYNGPVMHGSVNVYLIFYGAFTQNALEEQLVGYLIQDLSDSAYEAIAATYFDSSGSASGLLGLGGIVVDPDLSQGSTLTDDSIHSEIENFINAGTLAADDAGVYLVVPDQGIKVQSVCGGTLCETDCGCNSGATLKGVIRTSHTPYSFDGKYAVVAPLCNSCQWGFMTPNNNGGSDSSGQLDGILSEIAHELNEMITDPNGSTGWYSSGTGPRNVQMADFCEWGNSNQYVTAEGITYSVGNATANFHGGSGHDYMIQTLRANTQKGAFGYCTNSYAGVFWGQNFGSSWSPTAERDWSPGNFKGECENGQPLVGISSSPGSHAHGVLCESGSNASSFPQSTSCYSRYFGDGIGDDRGTIDSAIDWDPGYYKAECNLDEFVAGVSQSEPGDPFGQGRLNGLLCCPGNLGDSIEVGSVQVSHGQNSAGFTGVDWDYGYFKAQCPTGQYVAGASTFGPGGAVPDGIPHALLCRELPTVGVARR